VSKDHDIVKELRAWGSVGVDNFVDRAADEIERLRADVMCLKYQNAEFVRNLTMAQDERNTAVAERDEARREVLLWVKERCSWAELSQEIKQRKWEYLKEDGK
jgi:hypothetical protein